MERKESEVKAYAFEELLERNKNLIKDIENSILSNPNWVYYFLHISDVGGSNKDIEELVIAHPTDWENYINLDVEEISHFSVDVDIHIIDESEDGIYLRRSIYLGSFDEIVSRNKKQWSYNINETRANKLKEEIADLKKLLAEKEAELKKYES